MQSLFCKVLLKIMFLFDKREIIPLRPNYKKVKTFSEFLGLLYFYCYLYPYITLKITFLGS